jgi:hypothetical protein
VFERRSGRRGRSIWVLAAGMAVGLLLAAVLTGAPAAATYPVLPDSTWSPILSQLSGPTLTPGGTGAVSFRLGNPLPDEWEDARVSLEIYAFNPTDGGAVQPPPGGASPTFPGGTLGNNSTPPSFLPPGTSWNWSVPVTVPTTAPTGDYAVRFAVSFSMNNTTYVLESRGFFANATWASATHYVNGTPTINASDLGVSGVIPETSILVSPAGTPAVLYGILAVGIGLAGVGAYWWTRSETKSKSGARRPSPPQSAPRALGSSRSKDGD